MSINNPAVGVFEQTPPGAYSIVISCNNAIEIVAFNNTDIYQQIADAGGHGGHALGNPMFVQINGVQTQITTNQDGSDTDLVPFLLKNHIYRTLTITGYHLYSNYGWTNARLLVFVQKAATGISTPPFQVDSSLGSGRTNPTEGTLNTQQFIGFYVCLASGLAASLSYVSQTGNNYNSQQGKIAYDNEVAVRLSWNGNVFNVGDAWRIQIGNALPLTGIMTQADVDNMYVTTKPQTLSLGASDVIGVLTSFSANRSLTATDSIFVNTPHYYTSEPYPYLWNDKITSNGRILLGIPFYPHLDKLVGSAALTGGTIVQYEKDSFNQPNEDRLIGSAALTGGTIVQYLRDSIAPPNEDKLQSRVLLTSAIFVQYIVATYQTPPDDKLTSSAKITGAILT